MSDIDFFITRVSDEELVACYRGTDARDALARWLKAERLAGFITQGAHGRRYYAEVSGEQYLAEVSR